MNKYAKIIDLVLKAVGVGMSTAVIVLGILGAMTTETAVTLLAIGLFTISLAALQTADA